MESPNKAESKTERAARPDQEAQNDSDEELTPPSPIDIASVPAIASEFCAAEPAEGKRMAIENQNRLKTILEVAGVTGLTEIDARTFQDPEILRKLTNSVSCALDEAASALTRMKSEKHTYESFLRGASQAPSPLSIPAIMAQQLKQQQQQQPSPPTSSIAMPTNTPTNNSIGGSKGSGGTAAVMTQPKGGQPQAQQNSQPTPSDSMQTVQRLLTQGHTIQEATEDGESLLSLACSAGYYELAEVLLRMRASVEDRGVKGQLSHSIKGGLHLKPTKL